MNEHVEKMMEQAKKTDASKEEVEQELEQTLEALPLPESKKEEIKQNFREEVVEEWQ